MKRFRFRATALLLAAMAISCSFLGASCGSCTNPNATCDSLTCSAGDVFVCGNACAHQIALGAACSTDPCNVNGTCVAGAHCVPSSTSGAATCVSGGDAESPCTSTSDCQNDYVCSDVAACGRPGAGGNLCVPRVGEGQLCDAPGTSPTCLACTQGLDCKVVANPGGGIDQYRCVRSCTDASDCACATDNAPAATCTTVAATEACTSCVAVGQTCNAFHGCCDSQTAEGAQCQPTTVRTSEPIVNGMLGDIVVEGADYTCCYPAGHSCRSESDCCAGGEWTIYARNLAPPSYGYSINAMDCVDSICTPPGGTGGPPAACGSVSSGGCTGTNSNPNGLVGKSCTLEISGVGSSSENAFRLSCDCPDNYACVGSTATTGTCLCGGMPGVASPGGQLSADGTAAICDPTNDQGGNVLTNNGVPGCCPGLTCYFDALRGGVCGQPSTDADGNFECAAFDSTVNRLPTGQQCGFVDFTGYDFQVPCQHGSCPTAPLLSTQVCP